MARKRTQNEEVTTDATAGEELAVLAAALDGDGDPNIEIDVLEESDSRFQEAPETDDEVDGEVDDAEVAAAVEAEEAREEAYESQDSEIDVADEDEVAATEKASKGKRANTPRTKLPFDETIQAMFASEPCILDSDEGELDDKALKETLIDRVTQKKVKEKVVNLLQSVMNGSDPSRYTKVALDLLVKAHLADETVTLAQIKKAYEDLGLAGGTVNAQSGQMMALFPVLRIADKPERGVLKPNKNSVILDALAGQ